MKKIRPLILGLLLVMAAYIAAVNIGRPKDKLCLPQPIALAPTLKMCVTKQFPFSGKDSLCEWEEKIFKNKVVYNIEQGSGHSYVRAHSNGSASALYYKVKIDARNADPIVSWRWKVDKFPDKKMPESLEAKDENDFAARVYVIFPARFFTNSKVIEYVWAKDLPGGSSGTSPYFKNIKMLVVRSGPSKDWKFEERDIVQDYINLFGKRPEYDIGAVAFMTNTEHTGTSADAMYDDIKLGYKE